MTQFPRHERIRLSKKLDQWPESDQTLWRTALVPGALFEDGGARAGYSDVSNSMIVEGYGRWLKWLEAQGELHSGRSPGDRITPFRVRAYVADLKKNNASQTILNRLSNFTQRPG